MAGTMNLAPRRPRSHRSPLHMPPAPVRNRKRKPGQQHVVDAAMEHRRHPRQQRIRHRGRQRQPSDARPCQAGRARHRACPPTSSSEGRPCIPLQNESSAMTPASRACAESRSAQRRNDVPRAGSATARPRRDRQPTPPPGPAPGSATTPRRPQDDGSKATAARPARHRHQTTPPAPSRRPRDQAWPPRLPPPPRSARARPHRQSPRRPIGTPDLHPPQASRRRNRPGRHNLKPPSHLAPRYRVLPSIVAAAAARRDDPAARQAPPPDAPAEAPPAPAAASPG